MYHITSFLILKNYTQYQSSEPEVWENVVGRGSYFVNSYTSMVSMALFLKSGPCFFLPSEGPLAGIFTWRFLLVFITLPCQVNMKILHMNSKPYFVPYLTWIFTISLCLALLSLYQALGSWMTVLKVVSCYPALLLLPVFTFFTFGRHKKGENTLVISWKWTIVNMLISLCGATLRMLLHLEIVELQSWVYWIRDYKEVHQGRFFYYMLGCNCLTVLLTMVLPYTSLQYGVLLPTDPTTPHVLEQGAVVPLQPPQDPGLDLARLRRMGLWALLMAGMVALVKAYHASYQNVNDAITKIVLEIMW